MTGQRLREARALAGLSQAALARRAGVARPTIAAIEADRHRPSVDAAIAIARALDASVDELFAVDRTPPQLAAPTSRGLPESGLVRLVEVGGRVLAVIADPLVDGVSADARLAGEEVARLPGGREDGILVLGCDPAIRLLERLAPPGVRIVTGHATSGDALEALADGRCHAAVVHSTVGGPARLPEGTARLALARWRVGLGTRLPTDDVLDDLVAGRLRLVRQAPTAAAQQAVERWAKGRGVTLPRAAAEAVDHLEAARFARLGALAAVTYEPAALREGIAFTPIETHRVDLLIGVGPDRSAALVAELAASRAFRARLAALPGYEAVT